MNLPADVDNFLLAGSAESKDQYRTN